MTKSTRPNVSDPDLRAALERVGPHLEKYQQSLDLISKDIKAIEQYLTVSGVRLSEGVNIGYTERLTDGDYDVIGNYSGGIARDIERIEWGPVDEHGDRWRLLYAIVQHHGEVEAEGVTASHAPIDISERITTVFGPTFKGGVEYLERKPLIETPFAVRLKAHKNLAKLVSKLGTLVEAQPRIVPITLDDIPW
jgi:hypothetical protein